MIAVRSNHSSLELQERKDRTEMIFKTYYRVNNEQGQWLIRNSNHIMHERYRECVRDHREELN